MTTIPTALTVTDLRRKSAKVLKDLSEEKLFLLLQNSKLKGVVVDIDYFKMLQEVYEDYLDTQEFDKTIKEPVTSWKEYKKKSSKKR